MTPRSLLQFQKSTTGRFLSAAVRTLDAVAPAAAQRLALDLFLKPRRTPGSMVGHHFRIVGDGPDLAVWDWGDGPTVLLVHGWHGNAAQLSGFVAPLLRAGCYVAAADLPAHGVSGGARTNVRGLADAILRLGHRVGPVHAVIAHSFGATATVLALAQGLGARRAVLIAPPVDLPRYPRGFGAALGLSPRSAEAMLGRLDALLGGREAYDVLRTAAASARTTRLAVLHDPDDREVPFAEGRALAAAWPGAQFIPLPGAGHSRALRDPRIIARAVSLATGPETALALSA
ncbi:MAG TPA: alpha/beta hydrolase [Myxococcales bacterium]|nr:alpha/beta hydrolase [Myxococcales bacterium]